ncbi:MarR family winged helix-turn-helix transcriptional regulator [Actinomadura rupiterrae]|uniref:MarR family winged helix-turn-helix transcriptional regulator n=1 Tax=Actinomadura rupiterrae TaxID=559627 RepID=UPI0020A44D16|nr:MarR family transcriptional regulator [Actinomadura rupiterrae]MCP2341746.1 DNA-binding MarR family transcriptional regulator [Actinomadura rupiterrae]
MPDSHPAADLYREFVISFMLHNQAVAERLGLQTVDVAALILMEMRGPLPVGAISAELDLPSASATRLVDRLERGGYVRRTRSAQDRRAVIVEPVEDGMAGYYEAAMTSQRHLEKVAEHFGPEQAAVMLEMFTHVAAAYRGATQELRDKPT